jgi:hypothetical protein
VLLLTSFLTSFNFHIFCLVNQASKSYSLSINQSTMSAEVPSAATAAPHPMFAPSDPVRGRINPKSILEKKTATWKDRSFRQFVAMEEDMMGHLAASMTTQ